MKVFHPSACDIEATATGDVSEAELLHVGQLKRQHGAG